MTKKQTLSFISLWFFTIGIFSLGFSWLVLSSDCNLKRQEISRITDSQNNLLASFGVFGRKEKLPILKVAIKKRERFIKQNIENFKASCRSKKYKHQLVSLLKQYEIYLYMKQAVLQEKQDFDWHQSLFPEELAFKDF